MTWPREGSREIDEGIIVSVPMDWCKSPTGPVPYKIWAYQREAMNLADTVRQTDDRTHVKDSIILKCYGDEPGVGGGVISGTHNAECTPKTWSESVTAQGCNVVRHDDEWWMNHKNTWGQLNYTKDTNSYPTPDMAKIDPAMELAKYVGPLPANADDYQALVGPAPAGATGLLEMAPGAGAAGAGLVEAAPLAAAPEIIEGTTGTGTLLGGPAGAVIGAGVSIVIVAGVAIYIYTGHRTSQKPDTCPCVVAPYRDLENVCGKACKDGQAHHIVPDYTKRYGSREEGKAGINRINGLAGYYEGASICLLGNAATPNTEHWEAHGMDSTIASLGNHISTKITPQGTASIGLVRRYAELGTINTRPECAAQIKAGVSAEFSGKNPNILGRTYPDSRFPPTPETIPALRDQSPTIH